MDGHILVVDGGGLAAEDNEVSAVLKERPPIPGKQGFKAGREDKGIIQSSFLKLQYCKPPLRFP